MNFSSGADLRPSIRANKGTANAVRIWLVVYLIAFGTMLMVGLVNLWSAEPRPDTKPPLATPSLTAAGTHPVITAVDPGNAFVGSTAPMLTVQGRKFGSVADSG